MPLIHDRLAEQHVCPIPAVALFLRQLVDLLAPCQSSLLLALHVLVTVWERYLALELHEALHTLPKAMNRARIELAKPTTASHLDLGRFDAAAVAYRQEVKAISGDKDFVHALSLVRNGVAAHHGLSKGKGMDASIAWTRNAWKLAQSDTTPFQSQFTEYAVKLGRAIQHFGEGITSTSAA